MLLRSAAFLLFVAGVAVAQAAEPVSFEGKTVTMLIGSAAGGGTDASGRLVARYLGDRLPGKPIMVVKNFPGAQGMTSMNHFAKQVAPDGLTITMGASIQADPMFFRGPQSQYDPTKFLFIGGVGRGGSALLINKDAEKRLYDKSQPPVAIGTLGGMPHFALQMAAWGIHFLDWNAKWIVGYPGTNELSIALRRGEIDMTATSNLYLVQHLVTSEPFKILTQTGQTQNGETKGRPEFGDAPLITDLVRPKLTNALERDAFEYWLATSALDKWVALPPGTPDAFVEAYRTAYEATFNDPEFSQLGRAVSDGFEPIAWKDVTIPVQKLGATSPEAIAFIGTMLRKQGLKGE